MCHLKRPLRYGGYLCNQIQQNNFEMCLKFKRTMLSNVLTAKAISRALLSSYLTRYSKNRYSVATTALQFRNGVYHFVTELSTSCVMDLLIIHFGIQKYELSLINHLYRFATYV